MTNYKSFTLLPALLSVMLCTACSNTQSAPPEKPKPVKEKEATTFKLEKQNLDLSLHLPGELIAYNQVDLYAKVSSFVRSVKADIGTEVKKGQLLLTLEAPEMNSQLAAAESKLKSQEAIFTASKANYNRLYETSKTPGTISKNDLDQAMARKNSDEAQYAAAKASMREVSSMRDYLEIRAPFDGIISSRNVNPGAYVGPSGKGSELPLYTLQDQRNLRLVIAIPELYTAYLAHGTEVQFTVKSHPNEVFHAKIVRMSGALDNRLRSEKIEMDVKNNDLKLLPGMVTEVDVPLPAKANTFVIPKTALLDTDEGIFVIRVSNHKADWIKVSKGREAEDKIEIFGDLKEGDELITEASEEVRNGSRFD